MANTVQVSKDLIRNLSILLSIVLIVAGVFVFSLTQSPKQEPQSTSKIVAQRNEEIAYVNFIHAALKTFYASHGEYPKSMVSLISDTVENRNQYTSETGSNLMDAEHSLKSFAYNASSDRQSYSFSYVDLTGKEQTEVEK